MSAIEIVKNAKAVAVVGVSQNKEKYPYKIWRFLKDHGKTTYAVNPSLHEVDGEPVLPSLTDLPEGVDVAVAVVTPKVTETLPALCKERSIPVLWMQPGTYSDAVIEACRANQVEPIYGHCVLAEW